MWYKGGTVSVTNGSAVVTGSGTAFVANVKVGDAFVGPDDRSYEIVTVNSNTSLTISPSYLGSNQSGQSYRIQPTNGITVDLTNSVQSLIGTYSGVLAGAGTGQFSDGTVSVPGIRFTSDQDTGFYRSAANTMAAVTGGVARQVWAANGDVGFGTTSPAFNNGSGVEIERAGAATLRLENTADSVRAELVANSATVDLDVRGSHPLAFKWNGTERARINQIGYVGFGSTDPKTRLHVDGHILCGVSNGTFAGNLYYEGEGYKHRVAGGYGGYIIFNSGGGMQFRLATSAGTADGAATIYNAWAIFTSGNLIPGATNAQDIGNGGARLKDLYLVNAPSVSSDERLKNWQRSTLTEAEIAAGERILGELGFFQWLDMIAEKGAENARWHYGALAQEVVRIFVDEGVETFDPDLLDIEPDVFVAEEDRPSMRQAFLTFDTWDSEYEDDVLVRSAGNVFGFRPEQLAFFLLRVSHELRLRDKAAAELRMDALEQRIEALEGV